MIGPLEIKNRLAELDRCIADILNQSGRGGERITVVAVSKTIPAEYINIAIDCGISDIGESRIQETESKKPAIKSDARWHLIGHLQKNKVSRALNLYDLIQSVDSVELAEEISKRAENMAEILVQINCSGESPKFGMDLREAQEMIPRIAALERIKVLGLMTIGAFVDEENIIRQGFSSVRRLFEDLKKHEHAKLAMKHLSMGMSGDFRLALMEGANMVRIGNLIFGSRG